MKGKNPGPAQLDELPETLTTDDLARIFQTTTRTIRRLVGRRVLPPPQRFGRLARWPREAIRGILVG
jgi:hypothetical protein